MATNDRISAGPSLSHPMRQSPV
ncbi:hypothetical protein CPAR01_11734 [Colletotrichum paranaense]|uniref:Uncharacterized protein n=3 Tax=Colletotrichum acutatum species complex TaxID=2707335 RepID=A0AAI9V5L0_9PEZI|nr:hypothetical protein CSPX01_05946 [Colletotrichum filicis]KAK1471526.1 hypothetical protein CCUS01_06009 [Colletotrichum cuscutae]KAK1504562.1 hypothetical protein CTAM01_03869 [Colletotrichum tamarilloi]KAK1529422.1 hypothetical protein CPAR01_11734 [Colletotrichum paranaense]